MQDVTGAVLFAALGVAASPLPVVAVLVMLLSRRATVGSIAMASAWVLGNAVAIAVAIVFAGRIERPAQGLDLPAEGLLTALLGVGLIITAWLARRGRFRSADPLAPPRWVSAVDGFSPWGGAFIAFTNATTSPKNLALALSAGLAIQSVKSSPSVELTEATLYVAVACTAVVVPVLVYFLGGHRSRRTIERWKLTITSQASAIMEVTLFVFGAALMLKGLYNVLV
jgi:hypothetical protein